MSILECKSIIKSFGIQPLVVLRSITFIAERGDYISITGRSGSGKSTLLYIASGLDNPSSGEVILEGRNIHSMPSADLHYFRNMKMGFVFQFHYLLPELTAVENILMPARKFKQEKQKLKRAEELMDRFEILYCLGKYPSQMSGGEQQRVSIARALIMEPAILFADEPTGNLDSVNGDKVMSILDEINRTNQTTILLVTHEADYADMAKRRIHLVDGKIDSYTEIIHKKKRGGRNDKI
jgi:putative ABC transport system ATP-binding protein/lipoprotein-releasing system ATP-binding protein